MAVCDSNVCTSTLRLLIGQVEKHGVTPETKRMISIALESSLGIIICHQRASEPILAAVTKEQ